MPSSVHPKPHGFCTVLDPTYSVYGVKSVAVIPLDESGARTVVNSIFIRNSEVAQGLPSPTAATPGEVYNGPPLQIPTASRSNSQDVVTPAKATSSDPARPKVKFSDSEDVKILSPLAADFQFRSSSPPSPTSSGASTPVSESDTTAPVAKALAARLSFWSRLSKRQPSNSVTSAEEEPLRESLDERIETGVEEPKAVLQDLLDSTAPAPATVEERHSELDDKIVKECVKEFTKGGMYFAYNFGGFPCVSVLKWKSDWTLSDRSFSPFHLPCVLHPLDRHYDVSATQTTSIGRVEAKYFISPESEGFSLYLVG